MGFTSAHSSLPPYHVLTAREAWPVQSVAPSAYNLPVAFALARGELPRVARPTNIFLNSSFGPQETLSILPVSYKMLLSLFAKCCLIIFNIPAQGSKCLFLPLTYMVQIVKSLTLNHPGSLHPLPAPPNPSLVLRQLRQRKPHFIVGYVGKRGISTN